MTDERSKMDFIMDFVGPFKHIAVNILVKLDNKSLTKSRLVNKSWKTLIDQEKFYYVRQIQKKANSLKFKRFANNFPDWIHILKGFTTKQTIEDFLMNISAVFIQRK